MSGLSIYETRWIDLVFENRNKEYGAYRLRQESAKTSVVAFLTGMLFLAAIVSIPVAVNYLNPESKIELPDFTNRIIQLSDSTPFESKKNRKTSITGSQTTNHSSRPTERPTRKSYCRNSNNTNRSYSQKH
jgi:protein TonB